MSGPILVVPAEQRIANAGRYMRARWAQLTPEERRDLSGEAGTLTSIADLLGARLEPVV